MLIDSNNSVPLKRSYPLTQQASIIDETINKKSKPNPDSVSPRPNFIPSNSTNPLVYIKLNKSTISSVIINNPYLQQDAKNTLESSNNLKIDVLVTALHTACMNGDYNSVQSLLAANNVDINTQTIDGCTPLYFAVVGGQTKIVIHLLESGANVNKSDISGITPLYIALQNRHFDIANYLVDNNANVLAADKDNAKILHIACKSGIYKTIKKILEKIGKIKNPIKEINFKAIKGIAPIHVAAVRGDAEIVKLLIDNYANVNELDCDLNSPLHHATEQGYLKIIDILTSKSNYSIDQKNKYGNTPLHIAVATNNIEAVKLLLSKGVLIKTQNRKGNSPLISAVYSNNYDMAEFLLQNQADKNIQNCKGYAALHIAILIENYDIVSLIVKNGADINISNKKQLPPLCLALENGNKEIAKFLLDNNENVFANEPSIYEIINLACLLGDLEIFEKIIKKLEHDPISLFEIINMGNGKQLTPLETAINMGHYEIVTLLLDMGVNPNAHNTDYIPPIIIAVEREIYEKREAKSLNEGAVVNCQNAHNTDYIPPIIIDTEIDADTISKKLLSKGAVVNCQIKTGESPLYIAVENNDLQLIKLLLSPKALINSLLEPELVTQLLLLEKSSTNHKLPETVFCNLKLLQTWFLQLSKKTSVNFSLLQEELIRFKLLKKKLAETRNLLINFKTTDKKTTDKKTTPWLMAVTRGYKDIINFFLEENGANIDDQNENGNTALHISLINGNLAIAEELLKLGADINLKNESGNTPFHTYLSKRDMKLMSSFLEKVKDINSQNNDGNTFLHISLGNGNFLAAEDLLKLGADINSQNNYGNTVLHISLANGYFTIAEELLKLGADVNLKNECGNTPLHIYLGKRNTRLIPNFLSKITDINSQNDDGNTFLHISLNNSDFEIAEELLKLGVDVNLKNKYGNTPFYIYLDKYGSKLIPIFLEKITDINSQNDDGNTFLHITSNRKYCSIQSKSLIEKGADILIKNKKGCSPLDIAFKNNNHALIIAMLSILQKSEKREIDIDALIKIAMANKNDTLVKTLYKFQKEALNRN